MLIKILFINETVYAMGFAVCTANYQRKYHFKLLSRQIPSDSKCDIWYSNDALTNVHRCYVLKLVKLKLKHVTVNIIIYAYLACEYETDISIKLSFVHFHKL